VSYFILWDHITLQIIYNNHIDKLFLPKYQKHLFGL
jgi:hypothetical protein